MAAGSLNPSDTRLFQPPATEAGARPIGELLDAVVPNRDGQTWNDLDGALVEIAEGVAIDLSIGFLGRPAAFGGAMRVNDLVRIHGAGGGEARSGRVLGLNETKTVSYPDRSTALFRGLTRCQVYSTYGDSGAAVLDDRNNLVGVHLCGTETYSWFCPIARVLSQWGDLEIAK